MKYYSIDFETRGVVDLTRCGVYRYAEDVHTSILCMAFADGDEAPRLWLPGQKFPADLRKWVLQGGPLRAYNAQFERVIWNLVGRRKYGFPPTSRDQWYCTAADAAALSLPRSLGKVSTVLKAAEVKDNDQGRAAMFRLCRPKGASPDGLPIWNEKESDLAILYKYCLQDVQTERAVLARIRPVSGPEREIYLLDQRINDRGLKVDLPFLRAMKVVAARGVDAANQQLQTLTGGQVTAVTQVARLKNWVEERLDTEISSMSRATVRDLLTSDELPPEVHQVLTIRRGAAKASVAKLDAMERWANKDGRVRGMLLYHGAGTGRWTGRGPQPQNYPRGEVPNVETYIPLVLREDYQALERTGFHPLVIVSSLLRAVFVSPPKKVFMAADYSQIEARVLGWLAKEPYQAQEYERMAAAIFNVPVHEVTPQQRHIGKSTVLGCGYQMGSTTFRAQLWERDGLHISEGFADRAVDTYRSQKPGIVDLWQNVQEAACEAVKHPRAVIPVYEASRIRFTRRGQFLWCVLPSGRTLAYALPGFGAQETPWGGTVTGLHFYGVNGYTKRWEKRHAYGGLLVENIVQAVARDIMAAAMLRVEDEGFPVVLTVHDEILSEVSKRDADLNQFQDIIRAAPSWAEGLHLEVEGWTGTRYQK